MNKSLKSCPICGREVKLKHVEHEWIVVHPRTDECVYGLPSVVAYSAESMKKCVNGWNRKGNDDAID